MPLMDWIKRWNFIERARYERQLIEAFGNKTETATVNPTVSVY